MNIPSWKLPPGVCRGTWDYLQSREIAHEYDRKLSESPLLKLDEQFVLSHLPAFHEANTSPLVADFGCGTGRISRLLSPKGYRLLNVDLSPPMLAELQANCKHPELNRCVQANLVELDFLEPQSIDLAVCLFSSIGMIQRRANRQKFLSFVCGGLKPNAKLLLHVHNRYHSLWHPSGPSWLIKTWLQSLVSKSWEFGDRVFVDLGIPSMFLHIYSRSELVSDLRHAGFDSIEIVPISVPGDRLLQDNLLTRFRAGGFFAVASKFAETR